MVSPHPQVRGDEEETILAEEEEGDIACALVYSFS